MADNPGPSTQAEIPDFFVADTGYHWCKQCRNVRQGAWAFTGLCSYCCALPRGGFRTRYLSATPLELMPEGYVPRTGSPSSTPWNVLGFRVIFANPTG